MATKTENTKIADMQEKLFVIACRIKKAESPAEANRIFAEYEKLSAEHRALLNSCAVSVR